MAGGTTYLTPTEARGAMQVAQNKADQYARLLAYPDITLERAYICQERLNCAMEIVNEMRKLLDELRI